MTSIETRILSLITMFHKHYHRYPEPEWLATKLKLDIHVINNTLANLTKQKQIVRENGEIKGFGEDYGIEPKRILPERGSSVPVKSKDPGAGSKPVTPEHSDDNRLRSEGRKSSSDGGKLKYFPIIGLLTLFSVLEVVYYYIRLTDDGIQWWISLIAGVALTGFLMYLSYWTKKYKFLLVVIVGLMFFSVISTSAGQSSQVSTKIRVETEQQLAEHKEEASEFYAGTLSDLETELTRIDRELNLINTQKEATLSTLEDRYEWKNTTAAAEDRQRELEDQKKAVREQITSIQNEIRNVNPDEEVDVLTSNVYELWGGIFKTGASAMQFILQTALSIFIALGAPILMMILRGIHDER